MVILDLCLRCKGRNIIKECLCGCGIIIISRIGNSNKRGKKYVNGHNSIKNIERINYCNKCFGRNYIIQCKCGCNKTFPKYDYQNKERKYIFGHKDLTGRNHPNFRPRFKTTTGYWRIYVPNHHFTSKNKSVPEHRLIYEFYYKCCLLRWAHIHHKNGKRDDNRIENLEGFVGSKHRALHMKGNKLGKKRFN
jgi:hypothetical protein